MFLVKGTQTATTRVCNIFYMWCINAAVMLFRGSREQKTSSASQSTEEIIRPPPTHTKTFLLRSHTDRAANTTTPRVLRAQIHLSSNCELNNKEAHDRKWIHHQKTTNQIWFQTEHLWETFTVSKQLTDYLRIYLPASLTLIGSYLAESGKHTLTSVIFKTKQLISAPQDCRGGWWMVTSTCLKQQGSN